MNIIQSINENARKLKTIQQNWNLDFSFGKHVILKCFGMKMCQKSIFYRNFSFRESSKPALIGLMSTWQIDMLFLRYIRKQNRREQNKKTKAYFKMNFIPSNQCQIVANVLF